MIDLDLGQDRRRRWFGPFPQSAEFYAVFEGGRRTAEFRGIWVGFEGPRSLIQLKTRKVLFRGAQSQPRAEPSSCQINLLDATLPQAPGVTMPRRRRSVARLTRALRARTVGV